jgi:transcriptional regulator with XRE-family HTH domain
MAVTEENSFGALLRRWREARRMSQLGLALEAGVSARHVSFIETGRARPSREMVVTLAGVLDVPLRERNALLHAAGYAPAYRETGLDAPEMAEVRHALALLLKQHEPFAALAVDRRWDVVMANEAFVRFNALLTAQPPDRLAPLAVTPEPRANALRLLFAPGGWRPFIANWEAVAKAVLERAHREALWDGDAEVRRLLDEILSYPGVPARWREPDLQTPQDLLIPVEMRVGGHALSFFSTVTTLGSPQDITLQELRIESFHPVNAETEQIVRAMASP